jgi:hypothetical protein
MGIAALHPSYMLRAKHYFTKAGDLDKQATAAKRLLAKLYVGAV